MGRDGSSAGAFSKSIKARTVSTFQKTLSKILLTMNEMFPETIEVKLAFVLEDTANAFAILGLSDPPKEERRIHFFDTENLVLFDRGG